MIPISRPWFRTVLLLAAAGTALAGCQLPMPAMPTTTLQAAPVASAVFDAQIEALAAAPVEQWSTSLMSNPQLQERRQAARAKRSVQSVTQNWTERVSGFPGGATGRITSAPAYHYLTKIAYWLTERGWVLRRHMQTGVLTSFRLSATDTFPNTALTLSNDGQRAYVVSAQGNLFAVNLATGALLPGMPYALGAPNGAIGFFPPPFIDALASRPDGQAETLYALNHTGSLHRFHVSALHGQAASISHVQAYALPTDNTAPYTELFRSAPVVIGGRAVACTWRRHSTNTFNDNGSLIYFDTGVRAPQTTASAGALIRKVSLSNPVWAPPALEFDNNLVPTLAFFPMRTSVAMVDLSTGSVAQSVSLVVDKATPTSGSLDGYNYNTGGVTTLTKNAVAAATVTQTNTRDTANVYGARHLADGDDNRAYGYVKFNVGLADLLSGGMLRVITDAQVRMRSNSNSNQGGGQNYAPLRGFRVSDNLSGGGGWNNGNITFATRPTFEDGAVLDTTLANLAAHSDVELLPNANNSYTSGANYQWPAKGKVMLPGDHSFGFVHTELKRDAGPGFFAAIIDLLLGRIAPRFDAGTSPQLVLTLSAAGMVEPTLSNPVTIDSLNQQVFALNSNALFKVSYAGGAFTDRQASLEDPAKTFFALTELGRTPLASPLFSPSVGVFRFITNVAAPLFDGSYVYVQDNHPVYLRTAISRFVPGGPGVPPTFHASHVLNNLTADALTSSTYMAYDFESNRLFAATGNPTNNNGRAWVINRF
ncbi:MAG: hypothetical protein ACK46X_12760 [Candidatus Sericytochromatia bacterium]